MVCRCSQTDQTQHGAPPTNARRFWCSPVFSRVIWADRRRFGSTPHGPIKAFLLQAITDFALPDRVIREDALATGLSDITKEAGVTGPPAQSEFSASTPFALADVRDAALDGATRASDQRDFMTFGFDRWEPPQAA